MSDGSEKLVLEGNNLIVDGAGESIADMMVTPSATLVYAPEVMDTSNWNLAAITFGPAKESFGTPTYANTSCADGTSELVGANAGYVTLSAISDPTSWVNVAPTQNIIRVLTKSTNSYYTPPQKLPTYPSPLDKDLEKGVTHQYATVSADGQEFYGHFENRIKYNADDASSYCIGAFADGDEVRNLEVYLVDSLEGDFNSDPNLNLVISSDGAGTGAIGSSQAFNARERTDKYGFVALTHEAIVPTPSQAGVAYFGGTTLTNVAQYSEGKVRVTSKIHADDLLMFNLYGGLHHIGLWTYDNKASLESQAIPYSLTPDAEGETGLKYRLFAKKTFTEDLTRITNFESYSNLLIKWEIDFTL